MSKSTDIAFGTEAESRLFHAMGPILIGLMAPMIALFMIDPRALQNASVMLHIYLGALFVISAGAYIFTVFDQGEVSRVSFDRDTRTVTIERTGMIAKKIREIPFSEIASLRIETRYDDDGYRNDVPLLVLADREVIALPESTTAQDVSAMRAILGRG